MSSSNVFLIALFVFAMISLNNAGQQMGEQKKKNITVPELCPNNCNNITLDQAKDVCGVFSLTSLLYRKRSQNINDIYLLKEITEAKCNAAGTCHMEIKMELEGPTYKGAPSFHAGMDCTKKNAGSEAECTCVIYKD
uniref:Uncharacterized protein n=1 Tax=Cacopsylla melanoneura TaxID=428564 RepID=A0A8D9DXM4_9HEMI